MFQLPSLFRLALPLTADYPPNLLKYGKLKWLEQFVPAYLQPLPEI